MDKESQGSESSEEESKKRTIVTDNEGYITNRFLRGNFTFDYLQDCTCNECKLIKLTSTIQESQTNYKK